MGTLNFGTSHLTNYKLVFPFMSFLATRTTNEKGDDVLLYCKSVNLPEISMSPIIISNQFIDIKQPSKELIYGNLSVTFGVDELFDNYKFIHRWISYAKDPEVFGLKKSSVDASLHILSNKKNPKIKFILKDLFPINISSIPFTYESTDFEDLTVDVDFAFNYLTIE